MTVKQKIERQEQEFKELLGRVMCDPLAPVHDSVTKLNARFEELETILQEMRDVELSALGLHAEEVRKQVRLMKSKTGETPREVRLAVEPILQRLRAQVEQAQLATHELLKEEGKRVGRLHDLHSQDLLRLRENSVEERKQVEDRIAALATSLSEVRTVFSQQNHQLEALKKQQDVIAARMAEQLRHATQRMGMWLFAGAGLVCLGCIGAAFLIVEKL